MRFIVKNNRLHPVYEKTAQSFILSNAPSIPQPQMNTQYPINEDLQTLLQGKQLLHDDLTHPYELIQEHYENGYLQYRKSIAFEKNKPVCRRCGNTNPSLFAQFPCARCQEEACTYCRNCLMMGRVSSCTPLLSWAGPIIPPETIDSPLQWDGQLSAGQKKASNEVTQAIMENKNFLVWAVCGAGKTEVLFAGINEAIRQGKRVCIATPRTDVVLELAPRFKKAFPTIPIAALYGGSEDRHLHAQLTIATTHQLFRFYQAFDSLIVDEVDAFPYSNDETLQYAVQQARKPTSSIIYLTATPSEQWQGECRIGKRAYVTIPARFHRSSLPVPGFTWCGNWEKAINKNVLPSSVKRWLKERIDADKQTLLFLPKISNMKKILPIVQTLHPKVAAVHAEDPARKEKVLSMRKKEILILLTTTILERGVTLPNIDVAVLGAENRIFTESALVQIAGRVGRKAEAPTGTITFFHYGKTRAMVRARKQIVNMNIEAKKKGLIDD
ncbi:DEAD/DEAH box helicase [Cytobacillus purgationiresistens]|uniref:Competence protein ComFA n=1 Tax=Cytobacillus purgationiresistens TaxID=863449 RepID=A0ABU0ACX5_9BACI|nr:DEAD/DEAH box helicase [Cytobacillus purgationiresistens]MDQ0269098.1 competence protein ComFA [Cytobacillus purgationiresistens]